MTAITFGAAPRKVRRAAKPRRFIAAIARALDTYVAYRVQKAVPEAELLRAAQTIKRLSRSTESTQRPAR
jgi:hypothetical protein